MEKKGILFDMDGTLINTYENINYRQALSELKSVQKTLILKVLKSRVKSYADLERKVMSVVEHPKDGEEILARISQFLLEHYDNTSLKKNAAAFLEYLKAKGYIICLCTNNATLLVEHILRNKHIEEYFDYVITSQQVVRSKPDPQMYLEALRSVALQAEECYVFEDTENGILAARNAGIQDIIVVNDKEKRKFNDCLIIRDYTDARLYKIF